MVKNSFKICLQCDETKPKINYTYHQSHQLITRSNFIGFMDAPNLDDCCAERMFESLYLSPLIIFSLVFTEHRSLALFFKRS